MLILSLSASARAEPPGAAADRVRAGDPAQDKEYAASVDRALREYAQGNWPEAKVFFARAHQLRPSARTLRGLGLTAYELRSYVEACGYLRQALESRDNPLTDALRAQVSAALDEAAGFIAHYRPVVEPREARLEVDGAPARLVDGLLLLDPGSHELKVSAQGHDPASRTLVVHGGERGELKLTLSPRGPAEPIAQTPPTDSLPAPAFSPEAVPEPRSIWTTQHTIAFGIGIAAVVAAGVGATFGVLAANEKSASKDGCTRAGCDREGFEHRTNALERAQISTIAFVASGVLGAAGLVVYLTADESERISSGSAVALGPELARDGAGVALRGRW